VIARGIDLPGTKAFAERIRSTIASTSFTHDGATLCVTASLGISQPFGDAGVDGAGTRGECRPSPVRSQAWRTKSHMCCIVAW